jgi:hypothetical protein
VWRTHTSHWALKRWTHDTFFFGLYVTGYEPASHQHVFTARECNVVSSWRKIGTWCMNLFVNIISIGQCVSLWATFSLIKNVELRTTAVLKAWHFWIPITEIKPGIEGLTKQKLSSFIHFPFVPNLEHRAPFGVSGITHTRHPVGLLWTSDQPVTEASIYTGQHNMQTQETNIYAPSGIRTRDPSNWAAADLRLDRAATGIG